jgi:hypothetical protein
VLPVRELGTSPTRVAVSIPLGHLGVDGRWDGSAECQGSSGGAPEAPRGAHLWLQVRTRQVLNDDLPVDSHRWFPSFVHTSDRQPLLA